MWPSLINDPAAANTMANSVDKVRKAKLRKLERVRRIELPTRSLGSP
jgi:hypothetical protein